MLGAFGFIGRKKDSFSKRGVERLLQKAILRATGSGDFATQRDKTIKASIDWLRKSLEAEQTSYLVYIPAVGIDPANLPMTIGKISFLPGDAPTIGPIKRPVGNIMETAKNEKMTIKAYKRNIYKEIDNNFSGKIVCELTVKAGDVGNAEEKAVKECRITIDSINFFADLLMPRGTKACVSLLGEGSNVVSLLPIDERRKIRLLFREAHGEQQSSIQYKGIKINNFHCPMPARGPLLALALPIPDSQHAKTLGFARISELLAKEKRTSLEERILSAVQWAGRASVDNRREEAFLLYMIALESLILGSKTTSEITFQLKMRTIHLLKRQNDDRKALKKRIGDLYDIRSKIVHSGSFQVTDADLREARQNTKQALLTLINGQPFNTITTNEQLEEWFEDQLISSPGITPGDNA